MLIEHEARAAKRETRSEGLLEKLVFPLRVCFHGTEKPVNPVTSGPQKMAVLTGWLYQRGYLNKKEMTH